MFAILSGSFDISLARASFSAPLKRDAYSNAAPTTYAGNFSAPYFYILEAKGEVTTHFVPAPSNVAA